MRQSGIYITIHILGFQDLPRAFITLFSTLRGVTYVLRMVFVISVNIREADPYVSMFFEEPIFYVPKE